MRLLLSLLISLSLALTAQALVAVRRDENAAADIPSSIYAAAERSASVLAAAYVSSLNSQLNAKPTPATPPTIAVPTAPSSPNTPALPTTTTTPSSSISYAYTSYTTVATVTSYIWTGTGTPTGWPFVTATPSPPPPAPLESAAPAMLVSGMFTTMVAVVFSAIILAIVA